MKSIATMISQLAALIGTRDLTPWETEFVSDMQRFLQPGAQTTAMSPKQVEIVERIYKRHFADAEA